MYDFNKELYAETDVEQICEDVQVGKNVAVPTDLTNEPFWILLCNKAIHVVQESFLDAWDNSFVVKV
jgi:hypothetical protein